MSKPRIILVIASSIDGRIAFPDGGGSHLGTFEDKKILNNSLSEVDATLFGSGTLKAHQSNFLIKKFQAKNDIKISNKQPIAIVAGNPTKFSFDWKFFNQPIKRWLLNSNQEPFKDSSKFEKVFTLKNNMKDILELLQQEGLNSIALLGGSKLIYTFALEDLIDEIKITIVPKLIGGDYSWIPTSEKQSIFKSNQQWRLISSQELSTHEMFLHYSKIA